MFLLAYPGADPERVPMMRADYCLLLIAGKSRLMERARRETGSSPVVAWDEGTGGPSGPTHVTSMGQLYAILEAQGKRGGPRGL